MKSMRFVGFLALGCVLSSNLVFADFYAIPTKKKDYAPVEKTGQTLSYRNHDDGDLEEGVAWPSPRFTDNGNGTVTDNLTGLIWLKNANCAGDVVTWYAAVDYAAALCDGCKFCFGRFGDCGLSDGSHKGDWRLPNEKELQSLIDYSNSSPALPAAHLFTNVQSNLTDWYWTSNTSPVSINSAWVVTLGSGRMLVGSGKGGGHYAWCVRDGN